jgi:adenosylcobinamide-phosphate synthase
MSVAAILIALGLEQWRAFDWRGAVERAFVRFVRSLERKFNGGTFQHGVFAAVAAIVPPALLTAGIYWFAAATHPLLALLVTVGVLYFLMGFRRFSHAISTIVTALEAGDLTAARRALATWRGGSTLDLHSEDVARLAIERGLVDAYRQVFAVLFWFVVLPGPAGAVL